VSARYPWPVACLSAAVVLLVMLPAHDAVALEHRHGARIGYQVDRFTADSAGPFVFHSPALSYEGRYGSDWAGALRMSVLFPIHATDGVSTFSPPKEYDSVRSLDALLAVNHRFLRLSGWAFDGSLGPHVHFTRLRSSDYVEWTSSSMGLGLSAAVRRLLLQPLGAGLLEWGAHFDLSYDFVDFSHGGDLSGVLSAAASLSVAFAGGTEN
jgi:hypothetical protein